MRSPATGALSIVAIELQAPGEGADDARVFTRLSDSLEIWQVQIWGFLWDVRCRDMAACCMPCHSRVSL